MILVILSEKGGVSKSTLAVSIAFELMARGMRVLLVDADPQGTSFRAVEAGRAKAKATPTCIMMGAGLHGHDQLPAIAPSYQAVVIDTPGREESASRSALMVADYVLVPIGPSLPDVTTLGDTLRLVRDARTAKPELRMSIVLTRMTAAKADGMIRQKVIALGHPVLAVSMGFRTAWRECMSAGCGVTQFDPKSKAAEELRGIVDEIFTTEDIRAHG